MLNKTTAAPENRRPWRWYRVGAPEEHLSGSVLLRSSTRVGAPEEPGSVLLRSWLLRSRVGDSQERPSPTYQDALTPQPVPPPLDTNATALLQDAAAAATQVGAPEACSPQYLVETKVAMHAKAREGPPVPKPLHPRIKLDTAEHTPHDEWAAHYIIPRNTNRKSDAAKITVTRQLPYTRQVYELTAPNILVTHRQHAEGYSIQAEGSTAASLYTWATRGDPTRHPPSHPLLAHPFPHGRAPQQEAQTRRHTHSRPRGPAPTRRKTQGPHPPQRPHHPQNKRPTHQSV